MRAMTDIFLNLIKKKNKDETKNRENYIFYKIVDFIEINDEYIFQCINTKALFNLKLVDVVFDIDILYSLHPIQACYIGIEYVKKLKNTKNFPAFQAKRPKKLMNHSICRYGKYIFSYQTREGNICFINEKTHQEFTMDPRDIALSEDLISEFDAVQAFHIGYMAGIKMNIPVVKAQKPFLRLVK